MNSITLEDRILGSLMGLAIGDALGAPVEFKKRGSFEEVATYQSGGEFNLTAGQWTDDTSLALCLVESFLETKTFSLEDQMNRFMKWWKEGYMSSTGLCFDIGNTTKAALLRFEINKNPIAGDINDKASNGALMRMAPVPLYFHDSLFASIMHTKLQSQTTHSPKECVDSAICLSYVIHHCLYGMNKEKILKFIDLFELLDQKFNPIVHGEIYHKSPLEINAEGMAYNTLEASLYAFYHYDNFYDGLKFVVNLGDDSDTVGAVYGQIAGAYYGYSQIPASLKEGLFKGEFLLDRFKQFVQLVSSKNESVNND
jgi:ADP-ribosyl-[dinitrogen reductase] hydrolase